MSALQNTLLSHLRSLAAKQASGALSDRQLLEAFLTQRSEMSFAALLRRHRPMVWSVCRRVLGNHHDAEDAFQAVFLVFVRKAASIRKQESVSSFLHGVAYRIAEKSKVTAARRAARERTQARPPFDDPGEDLSWRELRSVLDEELTKLPESYRAPLVLCYLEGKTQDEAARLLGWSKSTLRRRLEQGRDTLGRQLTRRGVTLSAAFAAPLVADSAAQAALPPLLAASTVRAGLAAAMGSPANGIVSAQVAALAESGVAPLLAKKGSVVLVLLVSLTLGIGGLLGHRAIRSRSTVEAPAAPPSSSPPARSAGKDMAIEEKGDTIAISGRVFDPDGKPFSGAKIYLIGTGSRPKNHLVRAVSRSDGRFHFIFSKTEYLETAGWIRANAEMWCWCDIVAAAPGYGPMSAYIPDIHKELSLRLVKDVRIDGRVRDLEGRPVIAAKVRAIGSVCGSSWASLLNGATTDKEGQFHLEGVGRGREVELHIAAPSIETQWVKVKTPPAGPAVVEVLAGPTKPIEGTIRGRDTGKPLAGVQIWAKRNGGGTFGEDAPYLLRTVTDEQGRYRLLGLPKSRQYDLTAVPAVETGYLITSKLAADGEGLGPAPLDFDLRRGTIIRLRLIDKETGRPVRGAAQYAPLRESSFWDEAVEPDGPATVQLTRHYMYVHQTDRDKFIQFVAYPGPGVIYASSGSGNSLYLNARLDPEDEKNGHYPGMKGEPINGFLEISPGYRRIDPKTTDRLLVFDIVLDPGRTLSGMLVGPAGRPVRGATGWGLGLVGTESGTARGGEQFLETAAFIATGMERDKPCTLVFAHRKRKLIGRQIVRLEDKGPLTVRLQPWGTLTGRLVDSAGKPLTGVNVRLKSPDSLDSIMWPENLRFAVAVDGRFRVEGLLPDCDHELILKLATKENMILSAGNALKKLKTRAGEVKHLGDITVKAP